MSSIQPHASTLPQLPCAVPPSSTHFKASDRSFMKPLHFTTPETSLILSQTGEAGLAPSGQNWFSSGSVSTLKSKLYSKKILLSSNPQLFIDPRCSSEQNGKIITAFPPLREDTCSSLTQAVLCSMARCPNHGLTGCSCCGALHK